MDTEELISALADDGNVPSPDAVMGRLHGKQQRRARVAAAIGGCAVAAAVIAAGVTVAPRAGGPAESSASASGSSAAGTSLGPALTCGPVTLPERLAAAARAGASVMLADGTFTGHGVNGYDSVSLRNAATLSGPPVASGTSAWLPAATARLMLPGDGRVFAIVWPLAATRAAAAPSSSPPPGLALTAAPVSTGPGGGEVLLRAGNCWGGTPDMPLSAVERLVAAGP
jgi:hypothetical protein